MNSIENYFAVWLVAFEIAAELRPRVRAGRATLAEEQIARRCEQFVRLIQTSLIEELMSLGFVSIDQNSERSPSWPNTQFWSDLRLKTSAFLASLKRRYRDDGEQLNRELNHWISCLREHSEPITLEQLTPERLRTLLGISS